MFGRQFLDHDAADERLAAAAAAPSSSATSAAPGYGTAE
jgi:hypothetical protein